MAVLGKTTEAIAHFIGLFAISEEGARLRKAYEEFRAKQAHQHDPNQAEAKHITVKAALAPDDFNPGVFYLPVEPTLEKVVPFSHVTYNPPTIPAPHNVEPVIWPTHHINHPGVIASGEYEIQSPGSVEIQIVQHGVITDDDYTSVGNHGLVFNPTTDAPAQLAALVHMAEQFNPLSGLDTNGATATPETIMKFVDSAASILRSYDGPDGDAGPDVTQTVFVAKNTVMGNSYVNGELVDKVPLLDDYAHFPDKSKTDAIDGRTNQDSISHGGASTGQVATGAVGHAGGWSSGSVVDLDTGGNTQINTAFLSNQWASSHVMAAVGNLVQLDAIIQTNVWADNDSVGQALNGWKLSTDQATQAFNIAMFQTTDLSSQHQADLPAPGKFPSSWAVTTIKGDLTVMSWIEQISFMTDNDVTVISAGGSKVTVGTGDNTQSNSSILTELGKYYDLIIVGGHIYDANMIQQTNVLYDSDVIGAVDGFSTSGKGELSTQGNLLWNQANIHNYNGGGEISSLPQAYRDAAADFAAGKKSLPSGVLHDGAFEGLAGLRVLYISGNFVNLQYIKQTNVLGDSDHVAIARDNVLKGAKSDWTVSTGGNQLINLAEINDVDVSGKTYVGGHTYSDAVLVQADFVSNKPVLGAHNPDKLVTEAVAFLQDDTIVKGADHHGDIFAAPSIDHGATDPMHGMVS